MNNGYHGILLAKSKTTRCGFGKIRAVYSIRKKCNVYYGTISIKGKSYHFHDVDKEKVEKWLEEQSTGLDQYLYIENRKTEPDPDLKDTVNYKELSLKKEHFKRYEQVKKERILNGYSYGEE